MLLGGKQLCLRLALTLSIFFGMHNINTRVANK